MLSLNRTKGSFYQLHACLPTIFTDGLHPHSLMSNDKQFNATPG